MIEGEEARESLTASLVGETKGEEAIEEALDDLNKVYPWTRKGRADDIESGLNAEEEEEAEEGEVLNP